MKRLSEIGSLDGIKRPPFAPSSPSSSAPTPESLNPPLASQRPFPERWGREQLSIITGKNPALLRVEPAPEWASCPNCRSSAGWIFEADGSLSECRCVELRRLVQRYNRAEIPKEYARTSFDETNWDCSGWPEPLPDRAAYSAWLERLKPTDAGALFLGPTGTGKTHLSALAAHTLLGRGFGVRWIDWPQLLWEGRARAKRRGGIEEDLWPPPELESIDFLFLDEIGKEEPTDFSKRLLGKLIRSRCNAGLAIISTSNEDNGEALRSTLGDRIFFRLKERVWLKSISGANRRIGPSGERPF